MKRGLILRAVLAVLCIAVIGCRHTETAPEDLGFSVVREPKDPADLYALAAHFSREKPGWEIERVECWTESQIYRVRFKSVLVDGVLVRPATDVYFDDGEIVHLVYCEPFEYEYYRVLRQDEFEVVFHPRFEEWRVEDLLIYVRMASSNGWGERDTSDVSWLEVEQDLDAAGDLVIRVGTVTDGGTGIVESSAFPVLPSHDRRYYLSDNLASGAISDRVLEYGDPVALLDDYPKATIIRSWRNFELHRYADFRGHDFDVVAKDGRLHMAMVGSDYFTLCRPDSERSNSDAERAEWLALNQAFDLFYDGMSNRNWRQAEYYEKWYDAHPAKTR